jgi:hypothetical protein
MQLKETISVSKFLVIGQYKGFVLKVLPDAVKLVFPIIKKFLKEFTNSMNTDISNLFM